MSVIQPRTSDMVDLSPIDPGTYPATITACETGTSGAGNPKIVVSHEVTVPDRSEPAPRDNHLAITGKGTWGFDQLLRACSMEEIADRLKAGEDAPLDTEVFIGQSVMVIIDQHEYQGSMRDSIVGYLKA